ncbi:MAG TPA: hypothetical protein VJQ50_00455 [Terriglobales bacterium]|nr:hypothetical protein [Terriglobales bacterium]
MIVLIFAILLFNAVLPTKWLRLGGISLGDWVAVICYAAAMLHWLSPAHARIRKSEGICFLCMAAVTLSVFSCWAGGGEMKYMLENGRQVLHYLFFVPLICLATQRASLMRVLRIYLGIALAAAVLLNLYHFSPGLVNWDLGTGDIWEASDGVIRIFTPGMHYVFLALLGLMAYIPLSRGYRSLACAVACLTMLSALAWTGIRAYFVILAVCLGSLFLILGFTRRTRRLFNLAGAGLFCAVIAGGLFLETADAIGARLATLVGLREIPLTQFDTMGWRMLDAGNALSMIEGPREWLFGVFAKPYASEAWFGATPHIAYVGVIYHFGLLGTLCFAWLAAGISRRLVRHLAGLARQKAYDPLFAAAALVWLGLLLHSFVGGTFASGPAIITLLVVHFISVLPGRQSCPSRPVKL